MDFVIANAQLILITGVVLSLGLSAAYVRVRRKSARIEARLATAGDAGPGATANSGGLFDWFEQIGRKSASLMPTSEEARSVLRKRLIRAGYFSKSAPYWYTGIRMSAVIVPQIILLTCWAGFLNHYPTAYLVYASIGLGIVGFIGPSFYIDKKTSGLQDQYRDGFPDMMDLLVACVEAGLSLDAAVGRVCEEIVNRYPNLADHLRILTLELRAGRSRQDSWASLAERLGIDEARSLSTMLRQSEELGTSIGQTLKVFSDEMREKRMLTAEEKALALPAKLVVPLIVFVFPSLLGVLLLPAVVRMIWVMEQSGN